ncbi:MAG: hypothetical protein LBC48_01035 [Dysgonamonadaceae bacterium]|jgi:hypothetical protein|nr:hypothetical protein [Dysgonamonadaceae bacterium]
MKNGSIKIGTFVVLLISLFQVNIHAEVGNWKYYRAYRNADIVAETPHLVFAVYDGSLLSYNPEDKEVKLYSTQTVLSDIDIQYMAYSPEANALVLVYENANIDIFVGENEIYNLPTIKDDPDVLDKTIYNLEIIGKYAYISTSFGIVVVDISRREEKDRYSLGAITRSVCLWDDYLLAATDDGIKKAPVSSNLLDKGNWKPFEDLVLDGDNYRWIEKIFIFKDKFVINIWGNIYYLYQPRLVQELARNVRQAAVLDGQLTIVSSGEVLFYSDFDQLQRLPLDILSIDCRNSSGRYWVGLPDGGGLAAINKQDNADEYEMSVEGIKVDSPKRNLNFFMTFTSGKLLITGGGRGSYRNNTSGTLMVYENGQWTNFDENKIAQETGTYCLDFMSAVVDPRNTNRYFVGSWGEGVYEFEDNRFVKRYIDQNTNGKIQSANSYTDNFFRIDGLVYDRDNNLYMVNSDLSEGNPLVKLSANGQWENYPIESMSTAPFPNRILIDKNNYKWLNIWRMYPGLIVLNENNQQVGFSNTFKDQTDRNIDATGYLCMAEAMDGTIWVGTDNGPIQFSSPQQVANGECSRIISYDQYGEPFYPLEKEKINAIAIDGGDRKWLASENSGVFLVYQVDTVIDNMHRSMMNFENFNTSNSPILSNRVNSIAVNNETGEVFIGTDKGLCSYMSHVTPGKPDYSSGVHAFPNPVRPSSDTQVSITGLMQNSTVKITDMAGNLINQGRSTGSLYTWNCTNRSGEIVKAGVYLVFAASSDGSQGVVTKIMVVK